MVKRFIPNPYAYIAILIGMGHSVLAMSGEESLAQVNGKSLLPS